MPAREHISALARNIKKRTLYRASGGEPFPSSRASDLRKMFVGSIWNVPSLDFLLHEPRRIDFGLETLDEAHVDIISPAITPLSLHVISREVFSIFPPTVKTTDLLILTKVDPSLHHDGYLTSTRQLSTEPADWINGLKHQDDVFDISLLSPENGIARTTHQKFRQALMKYGLL